MNKIFLIVIGMFLLGCTTYKNIDDTDHNWVGDNGIEFKE